MKNTLTDAKFEFKDQIKFYRGKVRDVYYLKNDYRLALHHSILNDQRYAWLLL